MAKQKPIKDDTRNKQEGSHADVCMYDLPTGFAYVYSHHTRVPNCNTHVCGSGGSAGKHEMLTQNRFAECQI